MPYCNMKIYLATPKRMDCLAEIDIIAKILNSLRIELNLEIIFSAFSCKKRHRGEINSFETNFRNYSAANISEDN